MSICAKIVPERDKIYKDQETVMYYDKKQGFLLIELLVALLIFVSCVSLVAHYQWNTLKEQQSSVSYMKALNTLHSYSEQIKIDPDMGKKKSTIERDGFKIICKQELLPHPSKMNQELDNSKLQALLHATQILVSWTNVYNTIESVELVVFY